MWPEIYYLPSFSFLILFPELSDVRTEALSPAEALTASGGGDPDARRGGTSREPPMKLSESAYARQTAREFMVLGIAALGAYLFFVHGALYLQPGSSARPLTLEGFLLVTTVLYLFLRLMIIVASLYMPRPRPEFVVCPECGKQLEDDSPEGIARHLRITVSPRPTEREVLAAIMLRKAIDEARRSAQKNLAGPSDGVVRVPGDVENLPVPVEEMNRILRDLDHPSHIRGPDDRVRRGPPDPP